MTSGITPITTASSNSADMSTAAERKREHGMTVLRDREAKALISLGTDALGEACHMGHQLHSAIYDNDTATNSTKLQDTLAETLTCMERAEHYLLMLGSNLEENSPPAEASDSWPDR